MRIERRRATRVGDSVEVIGDPPVTTGRRLTFVVRAVDLSGRVVAVGEIDRAIVEIDRFVATPS